MQAQKLFIGDLSKKTSVPIKTIRYYEDLGLLQKPKRSDSSYRIYTDRDVERLLFIKKSKELGLTLSEIKQILNEGEKGLKPTCCYVREVFNKKIKEYETKIKELADIKATLEYKLKHWIEPKDARRVHFTVCPQIEDSRKQRKGK